MDKSNPKDEVQKSPQEVEEKKDTDIREGINLPNLKEKVQKLIREAQETKGQYIEGAIDLLFEAEKLLPQLSSEEYKYSERNMTQGKDNKEILYSSKLGNILYELKEYEEAAVCYRSIKDRLPNNVQVYKAYGDCYRKLNHYDDAIKQYEDGLKIDKKLDSPAPAVTAGLLNSKGLAFLDLKKYQEALADFEAAIKIRRKNPLYYCNSGYAAYALGKKDEALNHFKQANELVGSDQSGDLTKSNIKSILEKTQQFIQELEKLEALSLPTKDPIMDARGQQYREKGFEVLSERINAQEGTALSEPNNAQKGTDAISNIIDQEGPQLRETKENLIRIQNDLILNQYYDGFMFTLHQSYANAVIVNRGQLEIKKSGGALVNTLTSVISLVPGIGSHLSKGIKAIQGFLEEAEIKKSAGKVCSFGTTQFDFDSIAQDALCKIILAKETDLKLLNDTSVSEKKLSNWASLFTNLADSIGESKDKIVQSLYGERHETPLQQLGYQSATILVSDYIASGKIYGDTKPIMISRPDKRARLTDIVLKVVEQISTKP